MPATEHNITLQYWIVQHAGDYHTIDQIRQLAAHRVYNAQFMQGERKMLNMTARFDDSDIDATIRAALYAVNAAKLLCNEHNKKAHIKNIEIWIDGAKKTQLIFPLAPETA